MSTPTPPLTPEQLDIIAAYRRLSAIVAGPAGAALVGMQIPTRPQPTITDIQPPNGRASTPVTITGVELETTSDVFVGDKPAAPTNKTPTEVEFDVPSGLAEGPVKIAVKTSLGTAVSTQDFTVDL